MLFWVIVMFFSSFIVYCCFLWLKWSGDMVLFLLFFVVLLVSGRILYINDYNGKLMMSFVNIC